MAQPSNGKGSPSLPLTRNGQPAEAIPATDNSMAKPSNDQGNRPSTRNDSMASNDPGSPNRPPTRDGQPAETPPAPGAPVQHRFLTPAEWDRFAHGIGAIREGDETHQVVHPTCWLWPPKGMPAGLYRDVVRQRAKYHILYSVVSTVKWYLMILQLAIGASLTALGSMDNQVNFRTAIVALAALNTLDAGLLALLHNSGLPDRYRMDKVGYAKVEDYIKELLEAGVVEAHQTVADILSECYTRFRNAKATVLANKPEAYYGATSNNNTPQALGAAGQAKAAVPAAPASPTPVPPRQE